MTSIRIFGHTEHCLISPPGSTFSKMARAGGFRLITDDGDDSFDVAILWAPWTDFTVSPEQKQRSGARKIINDTGLSPLKSNVADHFERAFGYGMNVDPTTHVGEAVAKADSYNGSHSGRIVRCPIRPDEVDRRSVYQIVVDNRVNDEMILDLRVAIVGGLIPFVWRKFRPIATRFSNVNRNCELSSAEAEFSQKEIAQILAFCRSAGCEWGELDVLRDRTTNRIYIVDLNNAPMGPPNGSTEEEGKRAISLLVQAFNSAFVPPATSPAAARPAAAPMAQVLAPQQKKTLAVVTMAYNETDMLPIWLRYYGAQVGAEACYVVDHGTNDGSTDDLRGANRVRLPRSVLDNPKRTDFCAELCSALLKYYDYVMYTDSDEIVTPDPAEHRTLIDYVSAAERAPVTSALGLNLVHRLHHETQIDLSKPIIGQRRWGFPTSSMCKPLLIREPVKWAPGFHSSKHPIVFDGLYLFHLAYYDLQTALRRQEKRRQTEKKTADTAMHHRVGDDQVTAWISGWSSMKLDTDVTMRRDDPAVTEFAKRVADSAKGREEKVFGIDLGISGNRLWRIPARFVGQF
jgi:hypothetical protein